MEYARAIKEGTLELICPEMELLVCPSYHEAALKGTGVIRSDDFGRLYFRMISPFVPGATRHKALFSSKPVGEIYAPEDHVMLRAVDENGREWRSNQLPLNLSNQIALSNYHIRTNLVSIASFAERREIDYSSVRILIPNVRDLPFDMLTESRRFVAGKEAGGSFSFDHHEHKIGTAAVTFRREEDGFLSVLAGQKEPLMPTCTGLMCHSLGFALAQTMLPVVTVREFKDRSDLCLHSGPFWRYSSHMPSPVPFTGPQGKHFWRLIELFFTHIERRQFEPDPLLDELEGVRRGAQGSFQTACLILAVGIESITRLLLRDEFSALVPRPSIQQLLDHVDSWSGDVALKGRARSALSRLADVGVADLMYSWAKKTGANKDLVDAWKKLRHPKAHGEKVTEDSGWNLYCSAVELLHRIVAHAIGYDGPVLMTSQRGWGLDVHQNRGLRAGKPTQ